MGVCATDQVEPYQRVPYEAGCISLLLTGPERAGDHGGPKNLLMATSSVLRRGSATEASLDAAAWPFCCSRSPHSSLSFFRFRTSKCRPQPNESNAQQVLLSHTATQRILMLMLFPPIAVRLVPWNVVECVCMGRPLFKAAGYERLSRAALASAYVSDVSLSNNVGCMCSFQLLG